MAASSGTHVGTLNELKIWLEGEFRLIRSTQETSADEMRTLRKTVHDTNNAVSGLMMLDIPGKLDALKEEVKTHDTVIASLAKDQTALKTTMRAAYIAVGIAGAVFGSIVTIALQAYQLFGG